ncbi:helix-turn-helix domain-containing protein [bacterium]|nr:helix-turn-helix domain-containing protein [bacterium]
MSFEALGFVTSHLLTADSDLSATERLTLVVMASVADRHGESSHPGYQHLQDSVGCARSTAQATLRSLQRRGLIEDTGLRKGRTGQIRVFRLCLPVGVPVSAWPAHWSFTEGTDSRSLSDGRKVPAPGTLVERKGTDGRSLSGGKVPIDDVKGTDSLQPPSSLLEPVKEPKSNPSDCAPAPVSEPDGDTTIEEGVKVPVPGTFDGGATATADPATDRPDPLGWYLDLDPNDRPPGEPHRRPWVVGIDTGTGPRHERDLLFEAVREACRVQPTGMTRSSRSYLNRFVNELRDAGASPAEIRKRAARYRSPAIFGPDVTLSPAALAKWWPALDVAALKDTVRVCRWLSDTAEDNRGRWCLTHRKWETDHREVAA